MAPRHTLETRQGNSEEFDGHSTVIARAVRYALPSLTVRDARYYECAAGVLLFHCAETLMKEQIYRLPGFRYVEALSLINTLLWAILAVADMYRTAATAKRKAPLLVYGILGALSATSYVLTNHATLHLSVITQVVLRSSKLLWVMVARKLFLSQKPQSNTRQWLGAVCIVAGVVFVSVGMDNPIGSAQETKDGLLYLCASLACDALVYIIEEGVCFGQYHSQPNELILYMKLFALLPCAGYAVRSGDMATSAEYLSATPLFWICVFGYAASGYLGTTYLLSLIECFDGAAAATVSSTRKLFSVILSFAMFPRPLSMSFGAGAILIIGGGALSSTKKRKTL